MNNYNVKNKSLVFLSLVFFLILITVGYTSTTNFSRYIISGLRNTSILFVVISLFFILLRDGFTKSQILSLSLFGIIVLWGYSSSVLNNNLEIGIKKLLIDILVIISGFIILTIYHKNLKYFSGEIENYFLIYAVIVFFITIKVGGVSLDFPPHFIFEYTSEQKDNLILYSQGISKFFGMAALASLVAGYKRSQLTSQVLFYLLTGFFLMISLLGGARGDSLLAIFLCLTVIIIKIRWLIAPIVILFLALILFRVDFSWLNDLLIFQRLSVITEGNLGERGLLLSQSVNLLMNEPKCLLLGCGIDYFQLYYDYDMYPHNIFIEAMISHGLFVTLLILFGVTVGIKRYVKELGSLDFLLLLYAYTTLLGLKSGYLLGSWLFVTFKSFFSVTVF